MAGHILIDAQLGELRRRLPGTVYDEVADGLLETYERNLHAGQDPDTAASDAVLEFGTVEQVTAAFVRSAPGRRTAIALLLTGPMVGLCWAATFVTAAAWRWPVPQSVAVAFGMGLVVTIALLAVAARATTYGRTRLTALSGTGAILLDIALLMATITLAPTPVWPMALAVPASLGRIALTLRSLPRIVH